MTLLFAVAVWLVKIVFTWVIITGFLAILITVAACIYERYAETELWSPAGDREPVCWLCKHMVSNSKGMYCNFMHTPLRNAHVMMKHSTICGARSQAKRRSKK